MMEALQGFGLQRPGWLLALLPALLLAWLLYKRPQKSGWQHVLDPEFHALLCPDGQGARRSYAPGLLLLGWTLACLALAGPGWPRTHTGTAQPAPLVVALNLDLRQLANDTKPNRIIRIERKLKDLLKQQQGRPIGLLVYSDDAYPVTPISSDQRLLTHLLPSLKPELMPARGDNAPAAIALALEMIEGAGGIGELLLITDRVTPEQIESVAQRLPRGVRLNILGVGDENGVPVPYRDALLKNQSGAIEIARLDSQSLRQLAIETGGRFSPIRLDNNDLDRLQPQYAQNTERTVLAGESETTPASVWHWQDQGRWLLLLLLPLALLGFRRGWLALTLLCLLPLSPPGRAMEWDNLWQNADQRAKALLAEQPEQAARLFTNPAWQAEARYQAGDYRGAAELWQNLPDARAAYNRGNALAQLGEIEPAIAAYREALSRDSELEQAAHNLKLLEDFLQQQQQKKQNQGQAGAQRHPEGGGERDREKESESAQNTQQPGQSNPAQASEQPDHSDKQAEAAGQSEQQQAKGSAEQSSADASEQAAAERALQNWLRQVPDDPGELLERKFRLLQQQRAQREGHP